MGESVGQHLLRDYWAAALASQPDLAFDIQDVFEGHDMMTISYRNHRDVLAAETFHFDAAGRVVQAAACHRVEAT